MHQLTPEPESADRIVLPGSHRRQPEFWIVIAAAIACAVKIWIALSTFGTNDVTAFYKFGQSLSQHGLQATYASKISFNHPPLVAYFLRSIYGWSQSPFLAENGVTFPFLLRLPAIIADFFSVLVLLRLVKIIPGLRVPLWALALFALSPTSIMVSGFHGNTDPVMVLFLLLAAYACARENPIMCGLFLALSCQIKIIPLLLLPIFFFFWLHRGSTWRFLLPLAAASCVLWSEPLLKFPVLFFTNVIAYGSFWGIWGITYLLKLTGRAEFARVWYTDLSIAQTVVGTLLKVLIIALVAIIGWRRRTLPAAAIFRTLAYAWLVFFVFSPGVSAQYMVWLLPFILLLSPVLYGFLEAASTLFLFMFYNTIADAFPWYIAISDGRRTKQWVPWSLWPWAVLIVGLLLLLKHATRANDSLRLFSFATVRGTESTGVVALDAESLPVAR